MTKPKRRPVTLVRSSYQPSKAEQEEPIELPEGTTPDDLAEAVVQSVDVTWKPRPSALPYIIPINWVMSKRPKRDGARALTSRRKPEIDCPRY